MSMGCKAMGENRTEWVEQMVSKRRRGAGGCAGRTEYFSLDLKLEAFIRGGEGGMNI